MRNQTFYAAKEADNRRKLDITLRQFTGDRLSEEQRLLIRAAVSQRWQYSLQVCLTREEFRQVVNERDKGAITRLLFGSPDNPGEMPAAVLVCHTAPQRKSNEIYIYLPTEKEEERDDARQKESTEL